MEKEVKTHIQEGVKMTENPTRHEKVTRTTLGLRDAMFDELDALRNGTSTPKRAAAAARLAGAIVNSVKIEIEHQKHVATISNAAEGLPIPSANLQLGHGS